MVKAPNRFGMLTILVLSLLVAACSGAPRPQSIEAGGGRGGDSFDASGSDALGETTDTSLAPGSIDPATGQVVGAAGGTSAGGGVAGGGTGTGTGVVGAPGSGPDPGASIRPANLFTASEDRIGITDKNIELCVHAALVFGPAFDVTREDLDVYWQDLRERGGVHGRNFTVTYEDDVYDPVKAEEAAAKCKAKNPFMLLGGIGFDQIPTVRVWAERNRMLYYHHIAVGAGTAGQKFSFTPQPTVEQVGTAFGEYIAGKYADKRVGIVYRSSENWEPGSKAGRDYLQKAGVNVVEYLPVAKNATVYNNEIIKLKGRVDVIWIWENALAAGEFIKQANSQDVDATYVVFPFQTTLDITKGEMLKDNDIDGVASWSAFKPGGYGTTPFAPFGYDAEMKRFEAAMAKYRPRVKPNDIQWQTWLANKSIEDLFQRCGRDCTRNKMAGIFLSGLKTTVAPNCEVDFTRGNPYRGGWTFFTHEAFDTGQPSETGGTIANYRTTRWCSEHLR